ncbi:PREDICTED: choline transporter-like protein 5 isoform X2 [Miniopterus natalensis]|uniref:choline transporter-like protein 5 isoform X2 n=1 Tax=Miniopterus natalensis TaxID=291302 RepID=UPI0007A6E6C1|nr:PREDICTED: choline transporter-like protein 5 isoform X2 [Miniopterus natalensis]
MANEQCATAVLLDDKEAPSDSQLKNKQYGDSREFDPDFKGPVAKRSCTDVLCCMVFIVFITGYIFLGLIAWVHGDPRRVAYPTDSKGHFCGQKGTPNENKSILFYFNLFSCTSPSVMINLQCPTTQICVSKCPEKFLTYVEMQLPFRRDKNSWEYYNQFCKTPITQPAKSLSQVIMDDDCPTAIFPSKPFLRRCFPDFSTKNGTLTVGNKTAFEDGNGKTRSATELKAAAKNINRVLHAKAIGIKVFEDYATTWYWILIALTIAMLLSWMFLLLLRFIAGFLFWLFVLGVIGIIGFGIWHCYQEYSNLQELPNSHLKIYDLGIQTDIRMYFELRQTWLIFMIILSVLEVLVILMLIFLRTRIRISIALLKEGSKAIGYVPTTLIYPVLTFILLSICISYWAVIAVYLATSGVPVYKVVNQDGQCKYENKTCDPEVFNGTEISKACPHARCNFAFYGGNSLYHQYVTVLQIFNLFVFLWLINFVIALGQCALAGAFASYYWALRKPDDIPPHPLFTAFGRAIRYHTGSLAFGSLILALIQLFRITLEYLDKRIKDHQNNVSKFLQHCLKCCFWCLEKVVKFLNRNAYVMIAIYGRSFCRSARDAFDLLIRNILKIAVLDKVTEFVLVLGKILVSGCIGVLGFLLFTQRISIFIEGSTSLNYYWVPLLTVIVGSYLVAHGFFSVYAMCIDTIFICFLEDLERNDGSAERPYYMNQSLMKILEVKRTHAKKE